MRFLRKFCMKYMFIFPLLFLLGCGPLVHVENLKLLENDELQNASKVRIFTLESSRQSDQEFDIISIVEAYSCKNKTWDPPASKGDALLRLRLEAYRLNADAIIDVTFDKTGTDTWGTNCWNSVYASGQAIKYR